MERGSIMLSAIEEEKYYLKLFNQVEEKTGKQSVCDEIIVLANELNNLLPRLKKNCPDDPSHMACWEKIITSTKFLLALYHDKPGRCF